MNWKNRARKLEGRAKRRRYVQGTRAYLHAMTNSVARRVERKQAKLDPKRESDRNK